MIRKLIAAVALIAATATVTLANTGATARPHPRIDHEQTTAVKVCTGSFDWYQAAVADYNVRNGGSHTAANPWDANGKPAFFTLSQATQDAWIAAAKATVHRACFPIVP